MGAHSASAHRGDITTLTGPDLGARFQRLGAVADAVLYEGYLLYPYRASSGKNRVRWQFGIVAPSAWAERHGPVTPTVAGSIEAPVQQTECLLEAREHARLHVRVRFLQWQAKVVEAAGGADGRFAAVESLEVDGTVHVPFDEAVPREADLVTDLASLLAEPRTVPIALPGGDDVEPLVERSGRAVGRVVRRRWPVSATVTVAAGPADTPFPLVRLTIRVENTDTEVTADASRDDALRRSLLATHVVAAAEGGAFRSLLDPPEWAAAAAKACVNLHTFPVLAGEPGATDLLLSSPIILYDHPQIAPESPGDLHDAGEIDEILTLRTLTLTDDEKREARATDARAAAIVDRTDHLPPELMDKLHGAIRSLRPATDTWWEPGADEGIDPATDHVIVAGVRVSKGSRVRLRPRARGTDAHDMFLAGRVATVAAVLLDVDGSRQVAVTLDDDPGADLLAAYGRFFHFSPDEIEPLPARGRVLVAGIGNVFLGDDGFGVEVARRLVEAGPVHGVDIVDYGIRGVHLAYDLLDGRHDTLVLVDAVPMGEPPGTLAVLDVSDQQHGAADDAPAIDGHSMNPVAVLRLLDSLGAHVRRILVVGCEPAVIDEQMGLSPAVAAAVEPALCLVSEVLEAEAERVEVG